MNKTNVAQQPKTASFLPPVQGLLQRKCACGNHTFAGGACAECAKKSVLQRKLTIGASNDPLEQEADRVADQVMAAPLHSATSRGPVSIQRYAGQVSEGLEAAPASVEHVLTGSGRSLEPGLRQDMEQRFGHNFSQVRLHTGSAAEQSARDVNAHAYTVGNNVVFGSGQFAPGVHEGRRLIAHELTHVVQQSSADGTRVDQKQGLSPAYAPNSKTEGEADFFKKQIATGGNGRLTDSKSLNPLIQRQNLLSKGRGGAKLALSLPKQQLKAIGNSDINAIVDALPSLLLNGQSTVIKRASAGTIQHVFELAITIKPGAPPPSATEAAYVTAKNSISIGQTRTHPIVMEIFQVLPDAVMTLYHELIHVQLIVDRQLPADQQSETYRKFTQRLEMASDPALLKVTGTTPKKQAVFDFFSRLRAWYKTFVQGFDVPPAIDGPADDERYRTLINEYFANKEARRAFNKPEPNLPLAKRYARGVQAQFQIAAQEQGLFSILAQARQRAQSSSGLQSDYDVADQLGTALASLFDALDQQLQEIEKFKQSPPTSPSVPSNPYPRPLQIGGQQVQ
jgi:hypothetical protein